MTLISATQKPIPPGMIDLGIGQPSPWLLPAEAIAKAAADCAGHPGRMLLAYGPEQWSAGVAQAVLKAAGLDKAILVASKRFSASNNIVCLFANRALQDRDCPIRCAEGMRITASNIEPAATSSNVAPLR